MSSRKQTVLLIVTVTICIAAMLVVTLTNIQGLSQAIEQRTNNYLHDVSQQSAQVIQERFSGLINSLEIIGNSVALASVGNEEDFLHTKLTLTEFDAISYVHPDGRSVTAYRDGSTRLDEDVLAAYSDSQAFQEAMAGLTRAGFFEDYVAFMEPITDPDADPSDVYGVMIGVRSRESLQDLLVNDAFNGRGLTFLVDQYDEIVTHPMAESSSEALSEPVRDALTEITHKAQEEADAQRDSLSNVQTTLDMPDGVTYLLDYAPLNIFDWAVVTAVDENILAEVVNRYVVRIITTLVVLMTVLTVSLLALIAMQRRYQKRVEMVAFIDYLTEGMSFARFRMLADSLIERSEPGTYALVTLNVKRFKLVNRLGGTTEGDELLRRIYDIIQRNLRGVDELGAHNTADSFVMLLKNESTHRLQERLQDIAAQIESLEAAIPLRISQGVYVAPTADADIMMYVDRANSARISQGRDYQSTIVFYDDQFVATQEEQLQMISMIDEGLKKGEFTIFLQPKVNPATGEIRGAEALARWIHPGRGMIPPNVFIPLCEEHGLVCDLDQLMFTKVCQQIEEWQKKGWTPPTISVNVSGMHLRDLGFIERYRQIADAHHVDPSLIEFEITESIMFSDIGALEAREVINMIHEYGFLCSMDDFGSGYSALGLLGELPVDCIKLDRSFFIDCMGNMRALMVISSIIGLAHDLCIRIVAEGIETADQAEMLEALDCDLIQGFYYSRPLPTEAFEKLAFIEKKVYPQPRASEENTSQEALPPAAQHKESDQKDSKQEGGA